MANKNKGVSLDTAIARRKKELVKAQKEQEAARGDVVAMEERCDRVAATLSAYLLAHEGVKVEPNFFTVAELPDGADGHSYKISILEESGLDMVWVSRIALGFTAGAFPYRWAAKNGASVKKFDRFVDAMTFARTGMG